MLPTHVGRGTVITPFRKKFLLVLHTFILIWFMDFLLNYSVRRVRSVSTFCESFHISSGRMSEALKACRPSGGAESGACRQGEWPTLGLSSLL